MASSTRTTTRWLVVALVVALALVAGACGDDSDDGSTGDDGETTDDNATDDTAGDDTAGDDEVGDDEASDDEASDDAAAENACPSEGCTVTIDTVEQAGDELLVTWTPNFAPDVSRNHIHVYWDTFEPDQVSNDAADRGVDQGDWVPTADSPQFTTTGPVSTGAAGDSTTLCVTAADRDHNVLDAVLEDCRDVADLLS